MVESIYLDHAATTPVHPEVRQAMMACLEGSFGNPSSVHRVGRSAKQQLEQARSIVAKAIGARDSEIIFTSGGTESDFLALTGILLGGQARHLVTTSIEHHAILHTCDWLSSQGCEVTYVPPEKDGRVCAKRILDSIQPDTGLVSVMWVNNETGAVQPIAALADALRNSSVYLHTDAVQAVGSLSVNVKDTPVAALSLSGHKIFGPKGVGALYLRTDTPFRSMIRGGAQEKNRRAGTENLAGIIGLARAIELADKEREAREQIVLGYRERFLHHLVRELDGISDHSAPVYTGHILNIAFFGVPSETLLMALDLEGVFASAGSACTAGSVEPSHVLLAMGFSQDEVRSSVRFSFSPFQTRQEVDQAAAIVCKTVKRLRHNR